MTIDWGRYDHWHKVAERLPESGQKVKMAWLLEPNRECIGWYEKGEWMSEAKDWLLGAPEFWMEV